LVTRTVTGLTAEQLAYRPQPAANSIGWLIWHLTRIQDDHIADAAGSAQVWTSQEWAEKLDLPYSRHATGFGHSSREVARLSGVTSELLMGYHNAVHDRTVEYVGRLRVADLAEIIDDAWTPPVTLGVRLISVISDDLQHAGQAAFVRGVLERL